MGKRRTRRGPRSPLTALRTGPHAIGASWLGKCRISCQTMVVGSEKSDPATLPCVCVCVGGGGGGGAHTHGSQWSTLKGG